MPIGSVIGGLVSAGGASAAGATAANAGRVASQSLINAGDSAAKGSWQNANLYNRWIEPGYNAYQQLNALASNDADTRGAAQSYAYDAVTGSPEYLLAQPYLRDYDTAISGYDTGMKRNVGDTFTASPSYQFRLEQGQNALANSASARGMTLSGAQTKALTDYNQGAASQEYDNWMRNYQNWQNTVLNANRDYANTGLGVVGGATGNYYKNLNSLANTGFQAQDRNVQTNQQGVNYGWQGYAAGVPQYVQGQNALAGSQAAAANALGTGISDTIAKINEDAKWAVGTMMGGGWF